MKSSKIYLLVLTGTIVLTACSSFQIPVKTPTAERISSECSILDVDKAVSCQFKQSTTPTVLPTQEVNPQQNLTQTDSQGAITVEITPENLDKPGDTLIFDIAVDTHSVDLSMDLAQLTTLTTDSGITIQALNWDAPRGGHHVKGKLSFSTTLDGKDIFNGTTSFTVIIGNLDVPTRQFIWIVN